MICPLIRVSVKPPLDLPALHRSWTIRWKYGDQEGVLLAAICRCEVLCPERVRQEVLRQMFRAALVAAMERQHGRSGADR